VNKGRFWRGSTRPVVGMDIDPSHRPDVVGDNRDMPFEDGVFDVVVYDPPHLPNGGKGTKDFAARFGVGVKSGPESGYSLDHLYPPFAREAYRVLVDGGLLFCKIADYVHNHRYQWAHARMLEAATEAGFTACDCIIKVRKGPITSPRWRVAHHSRRRHCYWMVFRKSSSCERS